jgi:hypothetical protein
MKNWIYIIIGLLSINLNAQIISDESHLDLEFLKFKNKLLSIVIDKDVTKIKSMLADTIFESNNGCGYPGCPKKEFMEMYFNQSQADDTWNEFFQVIRFGFERVDNEDKNIGVLHDKIVFKGPSYKRKIDEDNEVLILGENVNIREKPSLNAKVIRISSYEKFNCDCNITTLKKSTYQTNKGIDWLEIKLENGTYGYVSADLTSYNLTKEITIGKVNGKWKVVSFFQPSGC